MEAAEGFSEAREQAGGTVDIAEGEDGRALKENFARPRLIQSKLKLAFIGFRHGHVMGLYHAARAHPHVDIVAAAEDHVETIDALKREGKVELTHSDWHELIE